MTYFCPFCKMQMIHQPNNYRKTTDDGLMAKVGDTFKCKCSIQQKDFNGTIWHLNSWKLEKDGWYYLNPINHIIPIEFPIPFKWIHQEKEPFSNVSEKVTFI